MTVYDSVEDKMLVQLLERHSVVTDYCDILLEEAYQFEEDTPERHQVMHEWTQVLQAQMALEEAIEKLSDGRDTLDFLLKAAASSKKQTIKLLRKSWKLNAELDAAEKDLEEGKVLPRTRESRDN
jgi:hypothetical protein